MLEEVFKHSTAGKKITTQLQKSPHSPIKIAFVDLDLTLTGLGKSEATTKARTLLEKQGFVVVFITNRTDEMMMSDESYTLSKQRYGYSRPPAHLKRDKKTKKRVYVKPEEYIEPGLINPDISAGTGGTRIYWKQLDNGYSEDKSYLSPTLPTPPEWRHAIFEIIHEVDPKHKLSRINPVCIEQSYFDGKTDVYPPDYWIELMFTNTTDKQLFTKKLLPTIRKKITQIPPNHHHTLAHLGSLTIIEDSDPQKNLFRLFLLPNRGKIDAVEHIINYITEQTTIKRASLQLLLVGDSWADLEMGFEGATNTHSQSTFLVVGGSRLTDYLLQKNQKDSPDNTIYEYANRLQPMKEKGFYTYRDTELVRTIVIGDEAFPHTLGPETIVAYLTTSSIVASFFAKTFQIIQSLFIKKL